MKHLLTETERVMRDAGYTPDDVVFIGSRESGHSCTWAEFTLLADVTYDAGYGGREVAGDVIIAFRDGGWLERGEYDGSEWWEMRRPFVAPAVTKPIRSLVRSMDYDGVEETLAEMNPEEPRAL